MTDNIKSLPRLATIHPSLFDQFEIEQFEDTILRPDKVPESVASEFFSRYPKFLLLGEGKEIRREVTLFNANGKSIGRVDFFRQSYGRSYWDIIELKQPHQPLITEKHNMHPRLSNAVHKAVDQASDYRKWIDEDSSLRARLLRKGILVYRPQIIVVIGRDEGNVKPEILRDLFDRIEKGPIEIRSYRDIYRFAKEHYMNNRTIILFGQFGNSRREVSNDIPIKVRFGGKTFYRGTPLECPNCKGSGRDITVLEDDEDYGFVAKGPSSYSERRVCHKCGLEIIQSAHARRGVYYRKAGFNNQIHAKYLENPRIDRRIPTSPTLTTFLF